LTPGLGKQTCQLLGGVGHRRLGQLRFQSCHVQRQFGKRAIVLVFRPDFPGPPGTVLGITPCYGGKKGYSQYRHEKTQPGLSSFVHPKPFPSFANRLSTNTLIVNISPAIAAYTSPAPARAENREARADIRERRAWRKKPLLHAGTIDSKVNRCAFSSLQ